MLDWVEKKPLTDITRIRKPRCFLLYALAPETIPPSAANDTINALCAEPTLPLSLYHDHFIGQVGGLVIFYAATDTERTALQHALPNHLQGWTYSIHPLIYSHSPAAFDAQTAYTLRVYRDADWEQLQKDKHPAYGNPSEEARTASEA